tara:strand:- start:191 stop:424 length:234 start_codon:yes stop_codon:yes gene_type:complete
VDSGSNIDDKRRAAVEIVFEAPQQPVQLDGETLQPKTTRDEAASMPDTPIEHSSSAKRTGLAGRQAWCALHAVVRKV